MIFNYNDGDDAKHEHELYAGHVGMKMVSDLSFTTLWANSADDKLMIFLLFLLFFQKTGFDILGPVIRKAGLGGSVRCASNW